VVRESRTIARIAAVAGSIGSAFAISPGFKRLMSFKLNLQKCYHEKPSFQIASGAYSNYSSNFCL
jgi:hypothetical protein